MSININQHKTTWRRLLRRHQPSSSSSAVEAHSSALTVGRRVLRREQTSCICLMTLRYTYINPRTVDLTTLRLSARTAASYPARRDDRRAETTSLTTTRRRQRRRPPDEIIVGDVRFGISDRSVNQTIDLRAMVRGDGERGRSEAGRAIRLEERGCFMTRRP